ncbi:hypothetical protein DXG01_001157 [Tephrocybe rancida]|nr:hypothetical protein DXG01_001157 [Tephrocybe rancida]
MPHCCSKLPYFSLQNSVFFPQSPTNPALHASSASPEDGKSPSFVSLNPPLPGTQSYCTVDGIGNAVGSPLQFSFGGKTDVFSLCANLRANNLWYTRRSQKGDGGSEICRVVEDDKIELYMDRRPYQPGQALCSYASS